MRMVDLEIPKTSRAMVMFSVALLLTGCNAEDETRQRVRRYFDIPARQEVDATTIRAALLTAVPIGAGKKDVYAYLEQTGIGKDGRSSCFPPEAGKIICRVEYSTKTLDIVKRSFGVYFLLDHGEKLRDIEIEEWLTGP